jgi:hypothetical protein
LVDVKSVTYALEVVLLVNTAFVVVLLLTVSPPILDELAVRLVKYPLVAVAFPNTALSA